MQGISTAYDEVLSEYFWQDTLAIDEPTDAVATSQPFLLPATLNRIKSVRDDNYTYYEDFTRAQRGVKYPHVWFYDTNVGTVLQSGGGAALTANSTAVTFDGDDALEADIVGEYIIFGSSSDVYLISARVSDTALTISNPFRAIAEGDIRNEAWTIRPSWTKRMQLADTSGTQVNPTSLVIEYQAKPLDVLRDEDYIVLSDAACDAVRIRALQIAMRGKGWNRAARDLDNDYNHALAKAKRNEPKKRESLTPKSMFQRPRNVNILNRSYTRGVL